MRQQFLPHVDDRAAQVTGHKRRIDDLVDYESA